MHGEHLLNSKNWVLEVLSGIWVTLSLLGTVDRRWGLLGPGRTTHQHEELSRARSHCEGVSNRNSTSQGQSLLHRAPPVRTLCPGAQILRQCRVHSMEVFTLQAPGLSTGREGAAPLMEGGGLHSASGNVF